MEERPMVAGVVGGLISSAVLCLVLGFCPPSKLCGQPGPRGERGLTGSAGEVGATGPQGDRGETGFKGDAGDQGPEGLRGDRGETGPNGPVGAKGDSAYDRIPVHMIPATYAIETTRGRGAGYAVDARHVHSCAHLFYVEGPLSIFVLKRVEGKPDEMVPAKLLSIDKAADIAIIETESDLPAWAEEDFNDKYVPGDAVVIVGNPSGAGVSATVGYLGQPIQGVNGMWTNLVLSGTATYKGNSGGPVFNAKTGKVIGVLVGGTGAPNVSLIVPLSKCKEFFGAK